MLATCDHCGHRNDVPDSAANSEVVCQKCAQPFYALSAEEIAANRRATKILLAAILVFFAIMALLLLTRSNSGTARLARQTLVGGGLADLLQGGSGSGNNEGGEGKSDGTGQSANGATRASGPNASTLNNNSFPDPQATNVERSPDASIGRLPQSMRARKPGDQIRPGAAGTDDPAERIGNSRAGQITNAPSAGANPGNSDLRNSVETPDGDELIAGRGAGSDAAPLQSTNSRPAALLLDDFSERLRQAGARSGDVQISLEWKNINDLDLHVIDPNGEEIFYNDRISTSGGHLDIDMNADRFSARPVENIYWPERGAPRGTYRVEVVHFANHGGRDPTQFTVRIVNKGTPSYYRGHIRHIGAPQRARITVCTFTVQ